MIHRPALRLVLVLAGLAGSLAAKAPTGGFDVPWDATRDQAIEIMAKQHRARFVSRLSSETLLLFTGGAWEDWPLQNVQLTLAEGGFVRGTAFFADRDGDAPDFEAVVSVLAEIYGRPESKGTTQAAWAWTAEEAASIRIELAQVPAGLRLTFAREPARAP